MFLTFSIITRFVKFAQYYYLKSLNSNFSNLLIEFAHQKPFELVFVFFIYHTLSFELGVKIRPSVFQLLHLILKVNS